jgi:hypothetical protein
MALPMAPGATIATRGFMSVSFGGKSA